MHSCVRRDTVALDFHNDFIHWAVVYTLHVQDEMANLCNGWEM